MYSTKRAFCALTNEGDVLVWGHSDYGGQFNNGVSQDLLRNKVVSIYSTARAFCALTNDGNVLVWGDTDAGGMFNNEVTEDLLKNKVVAIYSTDYAFCALTNNGNVFVWGHRDYGGEFNNRVSLVDLKNKVVNIYSTRTAFCALTNDGNVFVWGHSDYGGQFNNEFTQEDLKNKVVNIYSTNYAFCALTNDGNVLIWGHIKFGGKFNNGVTEENLKNKVSLYHKVQYEEDEITSLYLKLLKNDPCDVDNIKNIVVKYGLNTLFLILSNKEDDIFDEVKNCFILWYKQEYIKGENFDIIKLRKHLSMFVKLPEIYLINGEFRGELYKLDYNISIKDFIKNTIKKKYEQFQTMNGPNNRGDNIDQGGVTNQFYQKLLDEFFSMEKKESDFELYRNFGYLIAKMILEGYNIPFIERKYLYAIKLDLSFTMDRFLKLFISNSITYEDYKKDKEDYYKTLTSELRNDPSINGFVEGFHLIIPYYIIGVYNVNTIKGLISCNLENIILSNIKSLDSYDNIKQAILKISQDKKLSEDFITEVTGMKCSNTPIIYKIEGTGTNVFSHTCFNEIVIPMSYNDKSIDEIFVLLTVGM